MQTREQSHKRHLRSAADRHFLDNIGITTARCYILRREWPALTWVTPIICVFTLDLSSTARLCSVRVRIPYPGIIVVSVPLTATNYYITFLQLSLITISTFYIHL